MELSLSWKQKFCPRKLSTQPYDGISCNKLLAHAFSKDKCNARYKQTQKCKDMIVLKEVPISQEHPCSYVFFFLCFVLFFFLPPSWVTPALLHSRGSKQLITDAWLLHSCWTAGDVSDNKSQTLGGCLSPGWLLVCKWNHHSCSVRTLLEWGEKGAYGGRILMLVSGGSCLPPK